MNWMSKSTLEWFIRTDTLSLHNKCLMFTFSSFSSCFEDSGANEKRSRRKIFRKSSQEGSRKFAKIFEPCWRRGSRKGAVSVEEFFHSLADSMLLLSRIARQITSSRRRSSTFFAFIAFLRSRLWLSRESSRKNWLSLAALPTAICVQSSTTFPLLAELWKCYKNMITLNIVKTSAPYEFSRYKSFPFFLITNRAAAQLHTYACTTGTKNKKTASRCTHNVCMKICFVRFFTVMEGKTGVQGHQGGLKSAPKPWLQAVNGWRRSRQCVRNQDTSLKSIKLNGTTWVIGFLTTNLRFEHRLEFHGWFIASFTREEEDSLRTCLKFSGETFRINQMKTKSVSTSFTREFTDQSSHEGIYERETMARNNDANP